MQKKVLVVVIIVIGIAVVACSHMPYELEPIFGGGEIVQEEETLRWYYGTNVSKEMVMMVSEDYYSETGVQMEWVNAEEINIQTAFASGNPPDIFMIAAYEIKDWEPRMYDLSGQPWTEDVFETSLETGTIDGKLCGMPITYEACGLVYNKKLFKEAGITELPETVEELEDVCRRLEEAGIQPFGECYQLAGFTGHTLAVLFAYEENRKEFIDRLSVGEKTIADMDYYDQWLRLFNLTLDYGFGEKSVYYSVDDQVTDFANGKIAMIKQGTWLENLIMAANPEINMGIMAIPCTDSAKDCKLMVTTTNYLGVNKDSSKVQQALDFLNWLQNHAEEYLVQMEGDSVCYYSVDMESFGMLNKDVADYIRREQVFPHFGSEEWPVGYNDDILSVFSGYITGSVRQEELSEQLSAAYRVRSNN